MVSAYLKHFFFWHIQKGHGEKKATNPVLGAFPLGTRDMGSLPYSAWKDLNPLSNLVGNVILTRWGELLLVSPINAALPYIKYTNYLLEQGLKLASDCPYYHRITLFLSHTIWILCTLYKGVLPAPPPPLPFCVFCESSPFFLYLLLQMPHNNILEMLKFVLTFQSR